MKKKKNLLLSMILNAIIIVCELIAIFIDVFSKGNTWSLSSRIIYYTIDSNMLLLASSILFLIFSIVAYKKKAIMPKVLFTLRFFATCCVSITFLVVLLFLAPITGKFVEFLLTGHNFFYHTLCPILSFISFVIFEKDFILSKKYIYLSIIPTMFYGTVLMILNIVKVVEGPYPFLLVYNQPIWASILWYFAFVVFSLAIGFLILKLNTKNKNN